MARHHYSSFLYGVHSCATIDHRACHREHLTRTSPKGLHILRNALNRIVLWRAANALALSEDPPIDNDDYICPESWIGLEVHQLDPSGVLLASGRVFCFGPKEYVWQGRLSEGYIGVTILDVFVGNSNAIMSNERWLIFECKFPNGLSLQSTIDYLSRLPNDVDP